MRLKTMVLSALLVANIIILAFVPRFGWTLRSGNPADPYKYQEQRKVGNQVTAIYKSTDSILSIAYQNRFSNNLKLQFDNREEYTMIVQLGGASYTTPESERPFRLDFVESDIVWKDLSGIFYYRYILVIGAMFAYTLCLAKIKPSFSTGKKALYFSLGIGLSVLASLISFRVIL